MGAMFRLSLRNLASNKLRFGLTTFAVLLGVSFVVASFVLTDGLTRTFNHIVEQANADIDVQVRAKAGFDEIAVGDQRIDEQLVDTVASVDGVDHAMATASSLKIVPIKADGDAVETLGAPILSFNWDDTPLSPLTLVAGKIPDAPGEFALDEGTADRDGFTLGETYDVVGVDGREPFRLVGISRFGEENALAGAVLVSFTLDEVQRLDGSPGLVQYVDVATSLDPDVMVDRLNAILPADAEAVPGTTVLAEDKDDFSSVVDIFGNVLLAFALVAVFVSTFIIGNTFNILLGQRVRQLALLRALGASARQVRFGALFESAVVGVVASALGLGGGILLALGLRGLMGALGMSLPGMDVIVSARTIVAALVVGVGVTLLASLTPSRRAATVPPIAAMRSGFRFGSGEGKKRTVIAVVLSVLGVAALALGLTNATGSTASMLTLLGAGSALMFVAVSMYAPLFSTPSANVLGAPLEHLPGNHITGHIARQNAARNNKRTAATASGLMIGLALVAMASVVAESLKASFTSELGSTMIADYVITGQNDADFSNQIAGQVAALPEFDEVSSVRYGNMRIADDTEQVVGADLSILTDLMAVDVRSGDPADAANPDSIILTQQAADDHGVELGDPLTVEFSATGTRTLTVRAIYDNEFLVGNYMIDLSAWDAYFDSDNDSVISARLAPGVDLTAASAALAPIEEQFPQLQFETRDEFSDRLEGALDSLLVVIDVLLGLAIVIALLGITNTMALSVLERTQEIGLMRAVGMTRRQTKGMIRLEAAVVSLFGALLGVVVGLAFGWLAVVAIPESVINRIALPFRTLAMYVVVATLAGLVAASFPARRASRLDVLDAIAHE
jgi:putative ABC transport system permease protein